MIIVPKHGGRNLMTLKLEKSWNTEPGPIHVLPFPDDGSHLVTNQWQL